MRLTLMRISSAFCRASSTMNCVIWLICRLAASSDRPRLIVTESEVCAGRIARPWKVFE